MYLITLAECVGKTVATSAQLSYCKYIGHFVNQWVITYCPLESLWQPMLELWVTNKSKAHIEYNSWLNSF